MTPFEKALRTHVDGDVHFDEIHRKIYSVDASIYEVEPLGIVAPKTQQALATTLKIASDFKVPVIARGAATGITGGCLGKGLIIDTSTHLKQILEVNFEKEYALCEPGVVQDRLNEVLAKKGFRLGPDTSTGNRATLGGMVANNAAGAHSLLYGTMADHLQRLNLILPSGMSINFHELDQKEWQNKCLLNNPEGSIYHKLNFLRENHHKEIMAAFPPMARRVSGYNLEALVCPFPLNLSKLIAGSEGTLGIISEMQLSISKHPPFTGLCVIPFNTAAEGMERIPLMLNHHPIALEMIDHHIIKMGRASPTMRNKLDWLEGTPQALFIAEFSGQHSDEVALKLKRFTQEMHDSGIGFNARIMTQASEMKQLWDLRKAGLGLLLSRRSYTRAIGFLEDLSIPPQRLASFMQKFQDYMYRRGYNNIGIYGHAGSGCMHIRPFINLRDPKEVASLEKIMIDITHLLIEDQGVLSGEHGDGLVRSWLNRELFGKDIYELFKTIKHTFDPLGLMNPGKIVDGPAFLEDWRIDPETPIQKMDPFLNFDAEGGFELAVDLCNGNGQCRKAEQVMCPSFQVTGDEFDTTRARAQALRAIVHGRLPKEEFAGKALYELLDRCIQCKGCKTECPSQVDMTKMKTEFLYHYHRQHGMGLRDWLFGHIGRMNSFGSLWPWMYEKLSRSSLGKWVLNEIGITSERPLPPLAPIRFSKACRKKRARRERNPIILLSDTFTEFHHPEIGNAAILVLEGLGYSVIVPPWKCCGRTALSKGLLKNSQKLAKQLIDQLLPYAKKGIPLIGLEPSCLLTITDDYAGLLPENQERALVAQHCFLFDQFIAQHSDLNPSLFHPILSPTHIHTHCHQKALVGTKDAATLLQKLSAEKVELIEAGCCGMAGSFGYEAEHYDFSMQIAELKLLPAIRKVDKHVNVVANGFSCRQQILQGTGRSALHLAELLAKQRI